MSFCRMACAFLLVTVGAFAQDTPVRRFAPTANKTGQPSPQAISLSVPAGTPLQVALEKEVRVERVGQPLHGLLVQPVYAFDQLVLPVGSKVTGHISKIDRVPGKKLTLSILNADFTPPHPIEVTFDDLVLPDGKHLQLHTTVTPGSGQVVRLVSAGEHQKNVVKDAAAEKMEEAKQEWHNAMSQIEAPDKTHRLFRLGLAQLPVRPQYIDAGTLYFAELQQPLDFGSEPLPANAGATLGSVPPPGSLVRTLLVTPLNSATTQKGAPVQALVTKPLFDDGNRLILPQGSHLNGSVLQVRPARHLHHNGQLRIAFHELVLPDGIPQGVDTSIEGIQAGSADNARLDSEGGARATSSKMRYINTGVSVGLALIGSGGKRDVGLAGPAAGGATAFKLVGIAVGLIVRSHTLAILMSAYGGSRSIYTNFLGRGRDIAFPKNTVMEIGFGERNATPMTSAH